MIYGSLFSGIGGMDEGLRRAGHEVAFLCEKDEWRRSILAARFPGVPIFDDVHRVSLRAEAGRPVDAGNGGVADAGMQRGPGGLDLLCGGFPCQDLSVAGKRAGFKGERSSLFYEFARIAGELVRPGGYVLVENVPGLFSSHGGRDFASVLGTLADLGFHDLAWRVLDSQFFGVPQRRRRVFILARRARGRRCAEILLEPESRGGNPPTRRQTREGSTGTLGGGAGQRGCSPDTERMTFVAHALACHMIKGGDPTTDNYVADTVRSHPGPASNNLGNLAPPTGFHMTQDPVSVEDGVPAWGKGNAQGTASVAVSQASGVRRLTPTECERLQGLPDGWTLPGPDSRRYAGLGDAVTANVALWIGKRLMEYGQ